MNILILGRGYIGNALFSRLSIVGEYNVDWKSKAEIQYDDKRCLSNYIKDAYDIIINASGYTGRPNVDACEDNRDDTWYYNVTIPGIIADTCMEHNIKLIHVSSGCIYDGYDKPYTEQDEPNFGIKQPNSSWYSKTKHASELRLAGTGAHIMRIRMPFCSTTSGRNIMIKLLNYDYIINQKNSVTNVEDFANFIKSFISTPTELYSSGGIYNVVNPQPVSTAIIINALREHGIENPKWEYIELKELYDMHTTTSRSNCVLSDSKISGIGLELPDTMESLNRCAERIVDALDKTTVQ